MAKSRFSMNQKLRIVKTCEDGTDSIKSIKSNRSVLITGMTEAKAKVQLKYATKTTEMTADSNGKFSFSIASPKTRVEFIFTDSDTSGNESDVLTLKALDAMLPILKGITNTTIEAGTLFDLKVKVTAVDETDVDLTKSISISGKVDNKNQVCIVWRIA
ncbi:Ig-like domain-containing protein [Exiguobacterium acetylicum]|uniref:Ig-like domain-containing protein n=1 Tax=Exiguobacterium acetylicum TaxID=41170 RepID=UPI003977B40E